ncbi:reverse transcriptase domain-containing protein [Tanacetum coccineum]
MRTRSSSNSIVESSTIPKRRNRRRSKQIVEPELRTIVETPVATMADTRTMSELLQAPTQGYGDAIGIPAILAENFKLKVGLLQLVTSSQFHGFERDDPHAHIRRFNKITSTLKYKNVPHDAIKLMLFPFSLEGAAWIWLEKEAPHSILTWEDLVSKFVNYFFPPSKTTNLKNDFMNFQQKFDETFSEACDRFKDLLCKCPHHGFSELHQIDTFYNALTQSDQDSLNTAAGGNLLNRTPRDALTIIKNKSKVRTSQNKPIISKVSTTTASSPSPDVTALIEIVKELVLMNKANQQASVKAVEETCVTCGGPHPYYKCLATDSNTFNAYAATGTYVYGDYKPTIKNKDTGKEEVIHYEKFEEVHKKMISKNDEAKMVLYNALPKKEYERIIMCKTAKDVWNSLIITHQDELIGNLKVYEVVLEKDSEASKIKKEKYKSLALKARKVSSDEEESCSGSDEEYDMAVRDIKKFFRRRGMFVRQPYDDKKNLQKVKEEKKGKKGAKMLQVEEGDDSKDEICLMALDNNEVCLKVKLEPDEWIKDSGCSRHMTDNKEVFSTYEVINGGQICDKKCKVLFSETGSEILKDGITIGRGIRKNGLYIMKMGNSPKDNLCLTSIDDTSTLWHRRLGYANMRLIQSLSSKEFVRNLPKLIFENHFCDACNIGKKVHASHKDKNMVSSTKCLELLHMDLFGPLAVQSYGGNFYSLFIVDDYSRYTWTRFLKHKNEAFNHFEILSKKIQVQKGCPIISIRTDHGREFDNEVQFGAFCDANGKKPSLEYFRVFGSKCFILNTKDYLTKFDPKSTEGIFLGYSPNSKAYIILNKETMRIDESLNVRFDESPPPKSSPLVDDDIIESKIIENQIKDVKDKENRPLNKEIINIKESKDHPIETVIGNLNKRTLRSQVQNQSNFFVSCLP